MMISLLLLVVGDDGPSGVRTKRVLVQRISQRPAMGPHTRRHRRGRFLLDIKHTGGSCGVYSCHTTINAAQIRDDAIRHHPDTATALI